MPRWCANKGTREVMKTSRRQHERARVLLKEKGDREGGNRGHFGTGNAAHSLSNNNVTVAVVKAVAERMWLG